MSDYVSFLKARYARALLNTAAIGTDVEARLLVRALTTEVATPQTTTAVADRVKSALLAISALDKRMDARGISFASAEWIKSRKLIDEWIDVAGRALST